MTGNDLNLDLVVTVDDDGGGMLVCIPYVLMGSPLSFHHGRFARALGEYILFIIWWLLRKKDASLETLVVNFVTICEYFCGSKINREGRPSFCRC